MLVTSLIALLPAIAAAQVSGTVGPRTSASAKAAEKVCNVLDYGASANSTIDIGPPLKEAFQDCQTGGLVYIPEGDYLLSSWVSLVYGSGWALQLDGIIYRDKNVTDGGNMIFIEHTSDIEIFSNNSAGAIQGYGYLFHEQDEYGPRILRLNNVTDFSVHDLILVDSPAYFLNLVESYNGEVYNMVIRGASMGGLDGIDISGANYWIHDVEVTNGDECVTVKSPSANVRVENVFCNHSGGCAMGSLGTDTNISNIEFENIYTYNSTQMYMIKSNGGNGTVTNCSFKNFIGYSNAYMLDLDTYWGDESDGDGIKYENIGFENWKGTSSNGIQRSPIRILCPDANPCTNITLTAVELWTDTGDYVKQECSSAYGEGECLRQQNGTLASYSFTTTITSVPVTAYSPTTTMPGLISTSMDTTTSIPIPTIPTSFFPGASAYSTLMANM
ncbi:CAZyme family GH28 [Aspergillus niger]|uniref:Putative rhamnogalacturonase D n=2 Tax=Aspergillus niger TaxID=5061 RepID=RHGD_ASPNC|nr:uncharacterized protein An11g06320 [Aspergillus niger]XP_025459961.1 RGase D [Aspergillus niger CBS 101883]A2QWT2.1 RecName: Full=Putative rhamnogalacturonase D; Short=RGase D; Short=RHG D; Flags: Precursor [Aspergillus niger CBS 513.88]RDH21154.1 RGase D [Aspergillus niger ATCC 13496]ABD61570.1 putative endo-rhamnogalacturonase D [Aspergillus niger]KAI2812988.1 CAZyme family GH28 [Aspergillus niger]KAI2838283.1 CAZyme family GH28 [Aspergillus niger]KAI2869671.1 CAZyme family GH28 [Asperg